MGEDACDREHQHERKRSGRQDHPGGDVVYAGWKEDAFSSDREQYDAK
jgi:hypothetical protein